MIIGWMRCTCFCLSLSGAPFLHSSLLFILLIFNSLFFPALNLFEFLSWIYYMNLWFHEKVSSWESCLLGYMLLSTLVFDKKKCVPTFQEDLREIWVSSLSCEFIHKWVNVFFPCITSGLVQRGWENCVVVIHGLDSFTLVSHSACSFYLCYCSRCSFSVQIWSWWYPLCEEYWGLKQMDLEPGKCWNNSRVSALT